AASSCGRCRRRCAAAQCASVAGPCAAAARGRTAVFVLIIIVVGISRWCRVANAAENLVDATCPLLLQTSVKLYGIGGHVVLLLTCVFEGLVCLGSSPSASAQYISASFRYWRLCRSDFATTVRRANSFALALLLYLRLHGTYSGRPV